EIHTGKALPAPVTFIMPRSIPGGYGIYTYDKFIDKIYAIGNTGEKYAMTKDNYDAPRWYCMDSGKLISRIEYEVDLDKMEKGLASFDASVIRPGFAGILNYSVFGWIAGTETQGVQCTVETFNAWPVFSTLQPSTETAKGSFTFKADNYYTLAD